MDHLRYSGEFLSRTSVVWKINIYQKADTPFSSVGILRFPAEEPLVIEWDRTSKEEVMCGSTASLTLVSPGDRTYEDLYTIIPGSIRLEVLRNGALYWNGTLDPEFYEEPYIAYNEYEVGLTFSDFGILDRLKYNLSGTFTLESILKHALDRGRIQYSELNQSYLTTYLDAAVTQRATLEKISIRSDNFYDEDGEASTLYEVVEGMLRPLALRLMQKNGKIWVYDLNGLYLNAPVREVAWAGDDQTMGVDKVANNAKVTFSPYSDAKLLEQPINYEGEYSEEKINLTDYASPDDEYYSYYTDYARGSDASDEISFTIFLSEQGTGLAGKYSAAPYYHILPLSGGDESSGVAFSFYTGCNDLVHARPSSHKLNKQTQKDQTILMKTHRVFIPTLEKYEQQKYYIRLIQEMLIDARYNPFTPSGEGNEKGNFESMTGGFNYVFIPATVTLYDESGVALMHYSNQSVTESSDKVGDLLHTKGEWKTGAATYGSCWLSWYDPDDRQNSTGILGWKKNRHCVGRSTKPWSESFKKMKEGQYIPYPSSGGYLEVCIYVGVWACDYRDSGGVWQDDSWYEKIRWMLYQAPMLEVVRANVTYSEAESDDIEYAGMLNEFAKEDIELDTICGTMPDVCPTAKGVLFRIADRLQLNQIKELTRAGRTTQAEHLLIGTLYSQFAERKTLLAGTTDLLSTDLSVYKEKCQGEKRFICLGDIQDVIADESQLEIVELRPDEYKSDNE